MKFSILLVEELEKHTFVPRKARSYELKDTIIT